MQEKEKRWNSKKSLIDTKMSLNKTLMDKELWYLASVDIPSNKKYD